MWREILLTKVSALEESKKKRERKKPYSSPSPTACLCEHAYTHWHVCGVESQNIKNTCALISVACVNIKSITQAHMLHSGLAQEPQSKPRVPVKAAGMTRLLAEAHSQAFTHSPTVRNRSFSALAISEFLGLLCIFQTFHGMGGSISRKLGVWPGLTLRTGDSSCDVVWVSGCLYPDVWLEWAKDTENGTWTVWCHPTLQMGHRS